MSLSKKQIRNKNYYEKNKDRIIENVKARRTDKIKQEKPTETTTTTAETSTETTMTLTETMTVAETMAETLSTMSPPKRIIIRIPYPGVDF